VIADDTILNDSLRFEDEIVRHKILDLLGDLTLLGRPLKAHVIASKSGHASNVRFVRKLKEMLLTDRPSGEAATVVQAEYSTAAVAATEAASESLSVPMWVPSIRRLLPHRYPFLLVDRIIEYEEDKRVVGLKNVTVNEPFFTGHFPEIPIMPGVLVVEAMAQVGGILILCKEANRQKLAYLTGIDKCRMRSPILPGDQIRVEVDVIKLRTFSGKMAAKAIVDGKVCVEAELMFAIGDPPNEAGSERR